MISIDHVTKQFGRAVAVDDACLELAPGQSVALWGANGAGKTTLIRCVLGLVRYRGDIHVAGLDARREGKRARLAIGYVPQELGFYDELRVGEALRYFARLRGVLPQRAALESVGLAGHERKRVRELSGGMKQRLALAIALLGDPPILVLDEVTASLDAVGRTEFVGFLERLGGLGRTMLFASHRIEEVAVLARQVAIMERGRLTRVVPTAEFVAQQSGIATLHIHLHPTHRDEAIRTLKAGGFDPRLNGVGILVPVTPEHKAGPFRVLAEAHIPIDDFEVIQGAATGARS